MDHLKLLQDELLTEKWTNSSMLVSHLIKQQKEELSIKEIKELKSLAEIQIKNNISLKYFM